MTRIAILLLALSLPLHAQRAVVLGTSDVPNHRFGWIGDDGSKLARSIAPNQWPIKIPADKIDLTDSMGPVLDQGMLGSCHDSETEVLTDTGWKKFMDLDGSELLASVNPETTQLFFERPVRLIQMPYKGDLLCMDNQSLNFRVTPDHKMLVRKWDEAARTLSDNYTLVAAKDVGWYFGLMNRVNWDGGDHSTEFLLPGVPHKHVVQRSDASVPMRSWLNFLGLYTAEGTMYPREWCMERGNYRIQIAASTEIEHSFARGVFSAIGLKPTELRDRFSFCNKRIYSCMDAMGMVGVKAPQKRIPAFVFGLPGSLISEYLLGHFMGDGSSDKGHRSHSTSSEFLAEDLQRAVFLSGDESRIGSRPPRESTMKGGRVVRGRYPEYRVSVCEKKRLSVERKNMFTVPYDGIVYCAEVPTCHTLVTRRMGKILISGNCVGHGTTEAWDFAYFKATGRHLQLSRLMVYYNARAAEGSARVDSGCQIVDAVNSLQRLGGCLEPLWPYVVSRFAVKPPPDTYKEAKKHIVIQAFKLDNTDGVSIPLAITNGYPVVVGSLVYGGIQRLDASHCVLPMPRAGERPIGGHCYLLIAYNSQTQLYKARNSWGATWCERGNFCVPMAYIKSGRITEDCWCLREVSTP